MTRPRDGAAAPALEVFTAAAFTPAVSASPAGDMPLADMPVEDTSRAGIIR
jgi:hypothetical protein